MLERIAYAAGGTVKWLVLLGSAVMVALIMAPDPLLAIAGLAVVGTWIALVTNALGSLLAALVVMAGIREFRWGPRGPRSGSGYGIPRFRWVFHLVTG